VVEKNSVMGPNQQSMIKIGIVTGMILRRLIADNVVFINVSTWRKHWKFSYKDRSKKAMKAQSKTKALEHFNKSVVDDEADAILIGAYYV
ncbi:RuvC family protein, partial [Streptococcus agalactiae]